RVQVAHHHEEPVALEVLRTIRMRQPPDRLELEAGLAQRAGGPFLDRQVLDGLRVPVLETAVADAMAREVPPPADRLDGLDGSQPPLGQAIEVVTPLGRRLDGRQLLDLKILGRAFELHERRSPVLRLPWRSAMIRASAVA